MSMQLYGSAFSGAAAFLLLESQPTTTRLGAAAVVGGLAYFLLRDIPVTYGPHLGGALQKFDDKTGYTPAGPDQASLY